MNLEHVIEQLRIFAPVFGGRVAGAADFERGIETEGMLDLPAAYVVPMDEDAEDNDEQVGLYQVVTERIGVIVEFDNSGDRRGQSVSEQYGPVRAEIWRALLNWNPDPLHAPRGMSYGGGAWMSQDRARLFYRWEFLLHVQITDADGFDAVAAAEAGKPSGLEPAGVQPLLEIRANSNPGDPPLPADVVFPPQETTPGDAPNALRHPSPGPFASGSRHDAPDPGQRAADPGLQCGLRYPPT
jgi:hypothetical protein